ncbi:hypothetical protein H8356DRAFT_1343254 [Neocallimastix lanati (nom. inval.)]|nr:hypothetical protein H8356DRAFT_1343254 [Neocallimastix sp. JGI-2020a]
MSKKYESISFGVEEELEKPIRETEPLEILHYEFDTDKTKIFNDKDNSLIQGLVIAYREHYPITVFPDMIWILFLQGYSRFMEKYSELVRSEYVDFKGKVNLQVESGNGHFNNYNKQTWRSIIAEFVNKIKMNIGEDKVKNLESNF